LATLDIKPQGNVKISGNVFRGDGPSGGTGDYIATDEADGAVIELFNNSFIGNRSVPLRINGDNQIVTVNGCYFAGDQLTDIRVEGTGNDMHFSNNRFKMTAADDGIRVASGTHVRLRVNDCEINGGSDGIQVDSGATVTSLILRDNEFTGQSVAALTNNGSILDINSRDNIGLGDSGAATIALRSVGTFAESSNTSDLVIPLPSPIVAGDLLLMTITRWNNSSTDHTLPGGWTQITGGSAASTGGITTAYKIAGASETNPTVNFPTASNVRIGQIAAFSGVSNADPIDTLPADSFVENASAEDIGPIPGIVTTAAKAAVIVIGMRRTNWTSVATLSGDSLTWTEIAEAQTTTLGDVAHVWDYALAPTAGVISAKTFDVTGGTSTGGGVMFSLTPAQVIT
jgi:hypothetical protein